MKFILLSRNAETISTKFVKYSGRDLEKLKRKTEEGKAIQKMINDNREKTMKRKVSRTKSQLRRWVTCQWEKSQDAFDKSAKGKRRREAYESSARGKKIRQSYDKSEKGKDRKETYEKSEKGKDRTETYNKSERGRQKRNL